MASSSGPNWGGDASVIAGHRHLCAIVDGDDDYRALAADFLAAGHEQGEKTVAFGPQDSPLRAELGAVASTVADPYVDFLDRVALRPEIMFSAFHQHVERARCEGFTGLRVAADMDWLLPAAPTADEVLGFEVMLDRVLSGLDATVLCAYRRRSFGADTLRGTRCIHPVAIGEDAEPPFKLLADADDRWSLSGCVDLAVTTEFAAALGGTVARPWVIDVVDLDFVDVPGMRVIAEVARSADVPLQIANAASWMRRHWALARWSDVAPRVAFVD